MSAQWYESLEYILWDRLGRGESRLGNATLTATTLGRLSALSKAAGGWFRFSDGSEEETGEGLVFIDTAAWQDAYASWLERTPAVERPRDR